MKNSKTYKMPTTEEIEKMDKGQRLEAARDCYYLDCDEGRMEYIKRMLKNTFGISDNEVEQICK